MEFLKTTAEDYARYVAGSILTRKEALYSYTFYFIPRLGFSLLAMTFTEQQCAKIQAPALQAFLPKCHLNRYAAHSILFGPPKYGVLDLPNVYALQCVDQLSLFLGCLRAQDKTSHLIHTS
jgi:hypothetical protein